MGHELGWEVSVSCYKIHLIICLQSNLSSHVNNFKKKYLRLIAFAEA